ncbi:GAP family protein [Herbiconiux sp.]|uniref:GAP family protein n=1 Tax=Herbiconiux sp. TaxID=1871186 RepID=UPI0025BFC0A1|nr:GAP family protein [Herbiconiux sp.]
MELLGVVGALLPLGVAAALSSVPIAVMIALLLSPRSSSNGIGFLVGQLVGGFLLAWALGSGLSSISPRHAFGHMTVFGAAELVIGAALILYGILTLRRPSTPSRSPAGGWLDRIGSVQAWTALGVGVIVNLRPKALLLAVAAGIAIGSSRLSTAETIAAAAIYAALSSSVIGGLAITHLVRPDTTTAWLDRARTWLDAHGRLVTFMVAIIIGVVIIGDGLVRISR